MNLVLRFDDCGTRDLSAPLNSSPTVSRAEQPAAGFRAYAHRRGTHGKRVRDDRLNGAAAGGTSRKRSPRVLVVPGIARLGLGVTTAALRGRVQCHSAVVLRTIRDSSVAMIL